MVPKTFSSREFLVGIFGNERGLLQAVRRLRTEGFAIHDVYTPYAIHDMDDAMGLKPSHLPIVTFLAGTCALIFAMGFEFWSTAFNWRINVGGKPDNSSLAFLPVAFEVTVLVAGLATAAAFFLRSRLFPGSKKEPLDLRITNDRFAVMLERRDATFHDDVIRKILIETGALEIREQGVVS